MFSIRYITNAGKSLINSSLSGGGTIYWTSIKTSSEDPTEVSMPSLTNIISNTDYTSSGTITTSVPSGDGSILSIHGELNNNTYDGTAHTLGIWARLGANGNDVLAFVAKNAANEDDLVFHNIGSGSEIAFVDYTITLDPNDDIESAVVQSNYYASATALNAVIDSVSTLDTYVNNMSTRMVTLSDVQTISGNKTFTGTTLVGSDILPVSDEAASLGSSSLKFNTIYTEDCSVHGNASFGYITSNIIPFSSEFYDLGSYDNKWDYIYANSVYASTFYGDLNGTASNATSATSATYASILGSSSTTKLSYDTSGVITRTNILPYSTTSYSLGSSAKKFSDVYASTFHGSLDGNATTANSATHSTNLSNGSTSKLSASSDTVTAKVKIVPNASGTIDLGTSTYKWGSLYVTEIPGIVSGVSIVRNYNSWSTSGAGNITSTTTPYSMITGLKIGNVDVSDTVKRFIANALSSTASTTYGSDSSTGVGSIRLAALYRTNRNSPTPSYNSPYRNILVSGSDLRQVSMWGYSGNMSCYIQSYTYGSGAWLFINPIFEYEYAGYLIGLAVRIL